MSDNRKEYLKSYYQSHKQRYAETARIWRAQNPDKVSEYNHRQYIKRKEKKELEEKNNEHRLGPDKQHDGENGKIPWEP